MVGKTKTATKAQRRRFTDLQMVGCICCRLEGIAGDGHPEPADIHHITMGGRRLGHDYTIPLCPWHHRGVGVAGLPDSVLEAGKGPSLARSKRAFVARYGTEMQLLRMTNGHLERLRRAVA